MNIEINYGSWRQLDFPITINGLTVESINSTKFTLLSDGVEIVSLSMPSEISFANSTVSVFLDDSLTETLEKPYYDYELWISDHQSNPLYVTGGKLKIKPTYAGI